MINYCKTCGLRHPSQPRCLLHNRNIDPTKDFCSWHNKNPFKCAVCGNITMAPNFIDEGAATMVFCSRCAEELASCIGCAHSHTCSFETDPSPIPPVIQKTIRQGPMTQVIQVKNPDRIAITCKLNCSCWNGEYCSREDSWCNNHNLRNFVNSESDDNS
jgi:hypothetical protein